MTTAGHSPAETVERTGLSHDTLRYYEREGLIGPVPRDGGGRRRYEDADLEWIGLVTCLRDAGLGIADLRRFTELLRVGRLSRGSRAHHPTGSGLPSS